MPFSPIQRRNIDKVFFVSFIQKIGQTHAVKVKKFIRTFDIKEFFYELGHRCRVFGFIDKSFNLFYCLAFDIDFLF